jgi:hypothetical protein
MRLVRRQVVVQTEEERAIEAVGGLYEAVSPVALRDEVQELGVRALGLVNGSLLAVAAGLDQIEFLSAGFGLADPALIESFPRLRSLHVNGWAGRLDFGRLPNLEWLTIGDAHYASGLEGLLAQHSRLRHLSVLLYGAPDLRAIGDLPSLERLRLKQCKLRTLEGIAGAPRLAGLTLERCASLNSLAGIEGCQGLEYVRVQLSPRLRDLSPLAAIDRLRMLDVESTSAIESLKPLAGHPGLEVLYFSKIADQDLDPLGSMPMLKLIRAHGGQYNRDPAEFNRIGRIPPTDPIFRDVGRLVNP